MMFNYADSEIMRDDVGVVMRRVQNVRSEVAEERKEDENETDTIKIFLSSGCGCQLQDGGQCSNSFLEAHFAEYQSICLELSKG